MSRNLNAIVSDSGHLYLTARGFVPHHGSYYYPGTEYPHLHAGLRAIDAYTEVVTVTRIDERFGTERTRTGERTYAYQTLAFISYHLAGQSRARHIWSADSGWAQNINGVVTDFRTSLGASCGG